MLNKNIVEKEWAANVADSQKTDYNNDCSCHNLNTMYQP